MPVPPEDVDASHEAFEVTPQVQAGLLAVTATLPVPALVPTDALLGAIAYVQPLDCSTLNVCPAMVSVAMRAGPTCAATVKCTTVVPVPVAGTVTHGELEVALQAQLGELIVNVTLPEPPEASMTRPAPDRLAEQPLA